MCMEDNIIVTLSGKAHSGKDLVGQMIKKYLEELGMSGFTIAFADQLKNHCMRNFGYLDKDKDRKILQDFGTRVREIEPDFWALQVYHTIDAFRSMFDWFIITDARYKNELSLFPYNVAYPIVNIYVKRDVESGLTEEEQAHESEQLATNPNLDEDFHFIIDNNGAIEETYEQVMDIVNTILMQKADFVHQLEDMQPELLEKLKEAMNKVQSKEGDVDA